jgi:uncharacterized protein YutE (UPF0331/DUF86 family)
MTDADLLTKKLATIAEYLRRSDARLANPALATDADLQDAFAMGLLVAIQETLDIAFHVSADEGWGVPASNAESFELLAKHGVIEPLLAAELVKVARLRNRITHGYASVEAERLVRESPAGIDALRRFAAALSRWIG